MYEELLLLSHARRSRPIDFVGASAGFDAAVWGDLVDAGSHLGSSEVGGQKGAPSQIALSELPRHAQVDVIRRDLDLR